MTEAILKAIEGSRGREKKFSSLRHTEDGDETFRMEPRFRDALEVALEQRDEALSMSLNSRYTAAFRVKGDARIAEILEGK